MLISDHTKDEKHTLTYKIINIRKLINNENIPYIQPILEMKNYNKYNQSEYSQESEELYERVKKTQDYLNILICKTNMTIDKIANELLMNIEKENLNIDEIYTVISSYSFWEILVKLMKQRPLLKINKNNHQFNTLYKALIPVWFPNARNQFKELPPNLKRTTDDILRTTEILLVNNLVESVFETTPKILKNGLNETMLVVLTQSIPRYLIRTNYQKIYELMFNIPTQERYILEVENVLNLIQTKKNIKYSNEIKWLFLQSYEQIYQIIQDTKFNVDEIIELLLIPVHQDYIFDEFFERHPWTTELCNQIIDKLKT